MKRILSAGSKLVLAVSIGTPSAAFAASGYFGPVDTFLANVSGFINNVLVPLIFTVALLFFIYGMFKYFIQNGASEEAREKGKQMMLYSVIGFVLMVSIWGIVNLFAAGLQSSFGNVRNTAPDLPQLPSNSNSNSSAAPYYNYDSNTPQ